MCICQSSLLFYQYSSFVSALFTAYAQWTPVHLKWGLLLVCAACPTHRLNRSSSSVPPGTTPTIRSPPAPRRIQQPLARRVPRKVRSSASSLKFPYYLFSLMPSNSCLRYSDHTTIMKITKTYSISLRAGRVTICAVKSNKCYIWWVCVCSLSNTACKGHVPYYIVICGLSGSTVFFPHYLIKGAILGGRRNYWTWNACFDLLYNSSPKYFSFWE